MFGIGMQEILVVLVIALVVIGPKKLPEIAKALGKGYGEFRRAFEDMKSSINVDMKTDEEREQLRRLHERAAAPSDGQPTPEAMPETRRPPTVAVPPEGRPAPAAAPDAVPPAPEPAGTVYGDDEETKGDGD